MATKNPFTTKTRARFASRKSTPAAKRAKINESYELVAACPTLQGLPNYVLLYIMNLLTVQSLYYLSLACHRFYQLSQDRSVWEDVEITQKSLGRRIDIVKLKKFIKVRLPFTLTRVVIEEMFPKKPTLTEATLDLLFNTCPNIKTIVVIRGDFSKISASCLLFKSLPLRHVTLKDCLMKMDWMSATSPSWPHLQSLSLCGSSKTNDRDLLYIATHRRWKKFLKQLNLNGCYRLTVDAIAQACVALTGLGMVDISGTHHSSEQLKNKLKELKVARPNLLIHCNASS